MGSEVKEFETKLQKSSRGRRGEGQNAKRRKNRRVAPSLQFVKPLSYDFIIAKIRILIRLARNN